MELSTEFKRGFLSTKYGIEWVKKQPPGRISDLYEYWTSENGKTAIQLSIFDKGDDENDDGDNR